MPQYLYLQNDTRPELSQQANEWITYVISKQNVSQNGWLGPYLAPNADMNYWIRWPMMKAMLQWMEATGDERMLPSVMTQQRAMAALLPSTGLGYTWQGV